MRPRTITDQQIEQMRELRKNGVFIQSIADQFGYSHTIVGKYVRGFEKEPEPVKTPAFFSWDHYFKVCPLGM